MFLSNLFSTAEKNENIQILSPAEFKTALENPSVQLLDVRTPNEFAAGSIQGAKNLNLFDGAGFQRAAATLNKQKPVYLFCQSGNRSKSASKLLSQMGFTQIYDLRGGYSNWSY
jgi:rhodanese-related sulfurtransferase